MSRTRRAPYPEYDERMRRASGPRPRLAIRAGWPFDESGDARHVHQAMAHGIRRSLKAGVDLELGKDALDVSAHRIPADPELRRDVSPISSANQEGQDLAFPNRKMRCKECRLLVRGGLPGRRAQAVRH